MRTPTIQPHNHPMRATLERQDSATLSRWAEDYASNLNLDMMRLCQFILAGRPALQPQSTRIVCANTWTPQVAA